MTTDNEIYSSRKSKFTLLLLLVIFIVPSLGSWFLYNYTNIGKDGGASSNGDLILPPRPLENVDLLDPSSPDKKAELYRKWNLLYFTNENCDQTCVKNVYRMRQIRLAIGKHYGRIQRVLLVKQISDELELKATLKDFQGQLVVKSEKITQSFIDAFKVKGIEDPFSAGRLYLIDPLGNLMMSYSPDQDPAGIIKDLNKIFRVSRI